MPKLNPHQLILHILVLLILRFTLITTQTIKLPSQQGQSKTCPVPDPNLNYRPVIGIVSHPGDGASGRLRNGTNVSNIPASYVKFVESAGARVIPLIYTQPTDVLIKKLDLVNGVLFTGGWAKTGLYFEVVEKIFKKALEKNDAGEYFPIYAICLGFELISMIVSKDNNILESFSARSVASTLEFVENTSIQGTVFERFPPELLKKLSTDCLVMQNHRYGISPPRFQANQFLSSFFNVVTTCTDEDDKVYVSTVQAQQYPITAFQWHPEKNAFEWGSSHIPHSEDAIKVTQNAANFFIGGRISLFWYNNLSSKIHVRASTTDEHHYGLRQLEVIITIQLVSGYHRVRSEARKSSNRPPAQDVLDNLIYNYSPTYCGTKGKGYDEVYIFA